MNYIVLDLEFNQAFPFKSGKKVEPNPECPFEIIQIGAVKLNERFEQLDSFNCMISCNRCTSIALLYATRIIQLCNFYKSFLG